MSTAAARYSQSSLLDPCAVPHAKRWSKEEYNSLVDRGFFQGQHLYLFRGDLIEMAPMGYAHARSITRATKVLFSLFDPAKFDVRVQSPFDVPGPSMPEPDLLVCTLEAGRRTPHPAQAILIIEVSDSSIEHDRDKALEYAAAGVAEYWIVDLAVRCLEVYRNPIADQTALFGFRYPPPQMIQEGQSLHPIFNPSATVNVSDLLV